MPSHKAERLTQAERRANSEQSLLNAVTEILVEEGFTAATFDRISERSGYSRGMVRERFGSKEAFVEAAIRSTSEELESRYAALKGRRETALDAIQARIESAFDATESLDLKAYFVLLCASVANRLPQTQAIQQFHRRENRTYAALIEDAQDRGDLPETLNAMTLASLIGCLEIGVAVQSQIDPEMDTAELKATLDAVFELLANCK